jgi:hypothetical protein
VITEGSCNMQRFLNCTTQFTIFLHVDATSLLLLKPTHHRPEVQKLLEVQVLPFKCHIYRELCIITKFNNLVNITYISSVHAMR